MTRPPYGEAEAVARSIKFADAMDCPLCVVHVSCIEAAEVIQESESQRFSGNRRNLPSLSGSR